MLVAAEGSNCKGHPKCLQETFNDGILCHISSTDLETVTLLALKTQCSQFGLDIV